MTNLLTRTVRDLRRERTPLRSEEGDCLREPLSWREPLSRRKYHYSFTMSNQAGLPLTPREAELAQLGFAQRQIRREEKLKFRRRYPIASLPLLANRCLDASGFLPSVEMTDVGGVHEYHSFSQAPRSSFRALGEESRGVHAPNLATCAVPLRSGFLAAATRGNDTSASRAGDIQSGLPPVRRLLRRASKQRCGGTTPRVFESL